MIRIYGVDHEASPAVVELIHSLQVQVHEIPDLLVIAHMQDAGQTQDQIRALRARVDALNGLLSQRDDRVAELEAAGREALVELRRVSPSFAAPKLRALLEL